MENHSRQFCSSKNVRERILSYIYGEIDYDPTTQIQNERKHTNLEKMLDFEINEGDMFIFQDIYNNNESTGRTTDDNESNAGGFGGQE